MNSKLATESLLKMADEGIANIENELKYKNFHLKNKKLQLNINKLKNKND
jgi:hypothetical protein